jgi:hypothetical protein
MSDPTADRFDFSGLKSYAPTGLRVIAADSGYLQLERVTAARTMIFILLKESGEFRLHARNQAYGQFGRDFCNDANLVMRSNEIGRILRSLGYSRSRIRQAEQQLTLSQPRDNTPSAPPHK